MSVFEIVCSLSTPAVQAEMICVCVCGMQVCLKNGLDLRFHVLKSFFLMMHSLILRPVLDHRAFYASFTITKSKKHVALWYLLKNENYFYCILYIILFFPFFNMECTMKGFFQTNETYRALHKNCSCGKIIFSYLLKHCIIQLLSDYWFL